MTHGFPQDPNPLFSSNKFSIENRPGLEDQNIQHVLKELWKLKAPEITSDPASSTKDVKAFQDLVNYLSDWHLITFLPSSGIFSEVKKAVYVVHRGKH